MPRKRKPALPIRDTELDPFARQVEQALENVAQPAWLGNHSPLAAPYFLGQTLAHTAAGENAQERGKALQAVLRQAADQIDGELQEVLRVVYFQRNPYLDNVGVAMALHMAERTFYRMRIKAIQTLAHTLNQTLMPPLRPEMPIQSVMIGRVTAFNAAFAALQAGQSCYLSGPGGIGKTTLGAAILRHWLATTSAEQTDPQNLQTKHVFWYTLRSSFNDQVSSLLFALGYFLRNLGAGYTWRQLVADHGVTDPERVLGLLRYDINSLAPLQLLLCIDEIDALQEEASEHVQILHLVEELRSLCPILLLGQRVIITTDKHLHLTGIDQDELSKLLAHAHVPPLAADLQQQLLTYTRGNPALLLLFAALVRDGDDAASALQTLEKTPSIEGLFNRLWRRLGEDERQVLRQLAVFRNSAPYDAWQAQAPILEQLRQRELLQFDGYGGVQVLPHLQRLTYERIPAEQRPLLHLQAADIRETRSEYVAAMYHAIEGRQPARALWLWFVHRNQEIEHGRGAMALTLLNRISPADLLDERDRTALRTARAELLQSAGKPEEAEQELNHIVTPAKGVLRAYTRRLQGHAQEMQGRVEQALERYRESLESLLGAPQMHEVVVRNQLSFLHLYRQHNVEQARREALLARAKAEARLGDVEAMAGNYDRAQALYRSALAATEQAGNDLVALSRIYSFLGVLHIKQGNLDEALVAIEKAMDCDQKLGDQVAPLYDILNLAEVHKLAGRYETAYQEARRGLEQAEQLKHSYLIAGLAAGVSEACYELQMWDEAEQYATYSLSQEEEFFRASALVILGLIRQKQGNYTEGVNLLTAAIANANQLDDRYTEAYAWRSLAYIHRREGRWNEARAAYENALQLYSALHLTKELDQVQKQLQTLDIV
jgi:tetratricopeptide (TPR) repeat protein